MSTPLKTFLCRVSRSGPHLLHVHDQPSYYADVLRHQEMGWEMSDTCQLSGHEASDGNPVPKPFQIVDLTQKNRIPTRWSQEQFGDDHQARPHIIGMVHDDPIYEESPYPPIYPTDRSVLGQLSEDFASWMSDLNAMDQEFDRLEKLDAEKDVLEAKTYPTQSEQARLQNIRKEIRRIVWPEDVSVSEQPDPREGEQIIMVGIKFTEALDLINLINYPEEWIADRFRKDMAEALLKWVVTHEPSILEHEIERRKHERTRGQDPHGK
ncbi:hypothetical protein LCGC14_0363870 [marine sediment metagenome]|uniref:Uncharacterized protein n=1 Tax=marine sediment metagenome TaxID=412755 RepID=A0A0F9WFI7_9ZZZZ